MSTNRYCRDGLTITTYCGPMEHESPNSNSRTMVQITTHRGLFVGLTMDHWIDLVCFVRRMDRECEDITNYSEVE
jgi:hypothetical protein